MGGGVSAYMRTCARSCTRGEGELTCGSRWPVGERERKRGGAERLLA